MDSAARQRADSEGARAGPVIFRSPDFGMLAGVLTQRLAGHSRKDSAGILWANDF